MIEILNYGQFLDLEKPKNTLKTQILCHCPKCGKTHIRTYNNLMHSKEFIYCRKHKQQRSYEQKYGPGVTCAMKVPGAAEKYKQTKIEKYGENWGQDWYEAQKQRVKDIMGVENPAQVPDHWLKSLTSMTERFGSVERAYAHRQAGIELTAEKNYGSYENYTKIRLHNQIESLQEIYCDSSIDNINNTTKQKDARFDKYLTAIQTFDNVRILYKDDKYIFKCLECGLEFTISYENRIYKCPKCNMGIKPKGIINSINNYIKSLNLTTKLDEIVLPGYSVDIFVSNKNLAIDVLSVYTHSNIKSSANQEKTDFFEKNGYTLVSIMEDDWYNHQDAVKHKIKRILGLTASNVDGLSGYVNKITPTEYDDFCDTNHIWGKGAASLKLGLRVSGVLVAVLGLSAPRYRRNYTWEVTRFCIKKDYTVENALRAFLMWLIKDDEYVSLIYYQDKRWPDDTENTLEYIEDITPTAYYWKDDSRLYPWSVLRRNYIKSKKNFNFDADLTTKENLLKDGYNVIYDCGYRIYTYE